MARGQVGWPGLMILAGASVVACQRGGGDTRKSFGELGFSMVEPAGWTEKAELGSVVFVGPSALGQERNTIVVRSVPVEGETADRRTEKLVTPATRKVLEALPGAEIVSATPIGHGGLHGTAFELSFTPREKQGQRYQRSHLVLVGRSRILHLIHTAPEGRLQDTQDVFDEVVVTLREEA